MDYLQCNNSYKPIVNTAWVRVRLCKLQKGCTRFAAASAKVYQLLAHGRLFSPGTPASSTTKTDRHDIAEILLKVTLNIIRQILMIHDEILLKVALNTTTLTLCNPLSITVKLCMNLSCNITAYELYMYLLLKI